MSNKATNLIDLVYEKLKTAGFPKEIVQNILLPGWWQDGLASDATLFRAATTTICRILRVNFEDLIDPEKDIELQPVTERMIVCTDIFNEDSQDQ